MTTTSVSPVPKQIVLVGLSGVGKSTVGKALAQRLGWSYVDTDDLVTAREGKTPAEIITTRSEPRSATSRHAPSSRRRSRSR